MPVTLRGRRPPSLAPPPFFHVIPRGMFSPLLKPFFPRPGVSLTFFLKPPSHAQSRWYALISALFFFRGPFVFCRTEPIFPPPLLVPIIGFALPGSKASVCPFYPPSPFHRPDFRFFGELKGLFRGPKTFIFFFGCRRNCSLCFS